MYYKRDSLGFFDKYIRRPGEPPGEFEGLLISITRNMYQWALEIEIELTGYYVWRCIYCIS